MTLGQVRRYASAALRVALPGLVVASLLAALAPLGWPFELFVHFRWQLGVAAVLGAIVTLLLDDRRLAMFAVAALVVQAVPLAAQWHSPSASTSTGCLGPKFTVATVNLEFDNLDRARSIAWLNAHPADVVVLQEVTRAWADALRREVRGYAQVRLLPREDPYGIAVLSRWPILNVAPRDFARDGLPSFVVTVLAEDRSVEVIGLHSHWPVLPALYASRNRALHAAAAQARAAKVPVVIAGDLNLTPYAPMYRELLGESGLADAFADRAWRSTWQASWWPLALPIDHVLVPPSTCVQRAEIGAATGSDHRPVRVTIRWPR
jgi:endonuclease/exonuclease/phosphatase (EEP) superfamily protein YafD